MSIFGFWGVGSGNGFLDNRWEFDSFHQRIDVDRGGYHCHMTGGKPGVYGTLGHRRLETPGEGCGTGTVDSDGNSALEELERIAPVQQAVWTTWQFNAPADNGPG